MLNRTVFKQLLMRKQLQELKMKEQLEEEQLPFSFSSPPPSSPPQQPPPPRNVQVPGQVLVVHTQLENPTAYHLRETQRWQVRDYLLSQSSQGV
ncbi:hypothetical protein JTE90_005662 [Oedothorax gibbosus]|uniref:MiT/TFE transcription factors N-terminal domain-containing protein n=1 Tax=Oedothorax gibbosus TaxID=931172 RepID=A0AAV6UHE2_9ARAC|nr:hypothetical protein JTE90_005662 [Oedothorax gibbosus]